MSRNFSYRIIINRQSPTVIVKEKCQYIRRRVNRIKNHSTIYDYPSCAVGCRRIKSNELFIETSRAHTDYSRTQALKTALENLGIIGTVSYGNRIGWCAEPNAARSVIISFSCGLDQLCFTETIRPRTLEKIAYCKNCKNVFKL